MRWRCVRRSHPDAAPGGHGSRATGWAGGRAAPVATLPAPARDRRQLARRLAVDRDHHVVERRVGFSRTRSDAGRSAGARGVSQRRAVRSSPPDERDAIVDHDDLLVMRTRDGMGVVVANVDASMRLPREAVDRRELAVVPEHHRDSPSRGCGCRSFRRRRARRFRKSPSVSPGRRRPRRSAASGAAVEVPGEDDDRALGALGRRDERLEVVAPHRRGMRPGPRRTTAPQFAPSWNRVSGIAGAAAGVGMKAARADWAGMSRGVARTVPCRCGARCAPERRMGTRSAQNFHEVGE